MKASKTLLKTTYVWILAAAITASGAAAGEPVTDLTYAIDSRGTVCGYADVHGIMVEANGTRYMELKQKIFVMSTLLGATLNTNMDMTYHVDAATQKLMRLESTIDQGDYKLEARVTIEGDTARCWSSLIGKTKSVALTDDVILEGPLHAYHIKRDFIDGGATVMDYDVFSAQEFRIEKTTVTKIGDETIELAGETFETIIVETFNHPNSIRLKSWVNVEDGITVKLELPGDRVVCLADPSIKKKIELANLDENIVTTPTSPSPTCRQSRT